MNGAPEDDQRQPMEGVAELVDLIREFQDRAAKWLLRRPENMREFMTLLLSDVAEQLDFNAMQAHDTTTILPDFRERRNDLLLEVPFRVSEDEQRGSGLPATVWVYILFEHQTSEDARLGLLFHLVEAELWRQQLRDSMRSQGARSAPTISPVLPVVFYTGRRPWRRRISVRTLMQLPEVLRRFQPDGDVLLFSLPETSAVDLEAAGTPVGWILRVWQQARAETESFMQAYELAFTRLAGALAPDPVRRRELEHLLVAFLMHFREPAEQSVGLETYQRSAPTREEREEREVMTVSIAEDLERRGYQRGMQQGLQQGMQQGMQQGLQQGMQQGLEAARQTARSAVMRVLRRRFTDVPDDVKSRLETESDLDRLEVLIDRALTIAEVTQLFAE